MELCCEEAGISGVWSQVQVGERAVDSEKGTVEMRLSSTVSQACGFGMEGWVPAI